MDVPSDGELARAYSAARAAAASEADAIAATVAAAPHLAARPPATLVARAVQGAVNAAPAPSLAGLPPAEREAIALARLARLTVAEIAAATGGSPAQVRRDLTSGLRRLARDQPAGDPEATAGYPQPVLLPQLEHV